MSPPHPPTRVLAHAGLSVLGGLLALFTAGSAMGQTPAGTDGATERTHIAEQLVHEKLQVWQQRLHLDDWRISVVMARKSELKPRTLGGTRWDKHKKTATIWVLDPADYALPFPEVLTDLELTVVHELVHLELASLPRSEASRSTEEHAVNRLAEALLALDRQKR